MIKKNRNVLLELSHDPTSNFSTHKYASEPIRTEAKLNMQKNLCIKIFFLIFIIPLQYILQLANTL